MSELGPVRIHLDAPQVLDLVEADQVTQQIATAERELEALDREARERVQLANDAEATARDINIDTAATTWTIVRLQRFLDELRAEAERDANTMIAVARHHAQLRLVDARAMRERDGNRAAHSVSPSVVGQGIAWFESEFRSAPIVVVPDAPSLPDPLRHPDIPVATPMASSAPPNGAVAPHPAPTVLDAVPVSVPPPEVTAEPAVTAEMSAFAPPPPNAVVEEMPPVAPAPAAPVPAPAAVQPAPAVAPLVPAVDPEPGGSKRRATRRGSRRRLPISAILEIAAVLLLLAFIVMRLS